LLFFEINILNKNETSRHYQFSGSTNHRISQNVEKLDKIFDIFDVDFDETNCLHNIVTKAIVPEATSSDICNHDMEGEVLYQKFIQKQIEGDKSIWATVKLRRLNTFSNNNKIKLTRMQNKVISLKEDKSLFQRFFIVSQKRKDTDLSFVIGNYELTVSPKSLFSSDGQPLPCLDKYQVMHAIESLGDSSNDDFATQFVKQLLGEDAMALGNKVIKTKAIKTCKDFATQFIKQLLSEIKSYDEIRLIFDRYQENSYKLKHYCEIKDVLLYSTSLVRYMIQDNTNIERITLKRLLSHIETKHNLTIYLAKYAKQALDEIAKEYVIVYDTKSGTNLSRYNLELQTHNQEEADTLIILHRCS